MVYVDVVDKSLFPGAVGIYDTFEDAVQGMLADIRDGEAENSGYCETRYDASEGSCGTTAGEPADASGKWWSCEGICAVGPRRGVAWVEGAKWSYEPKDGRRLRSWKEASGRTASVVFRNCSIMEVSCS